MLKKTNVLVEVVQLPYPDVWHSLACPECSGYGNFDICLNCFGDGCQQCNQTGHYRGPLDSHFKCEHCSGTGTMRVYLEKRAVKRCLQLAKEGKAVVDIEWLKKVGLYGD